MSILNVDTLEFDPADSSDICTIKIDATHFIVCYRVADGDGHIKTFSVDAEANNITEIDSIEHEAATYSGQDRSGVLIDSTHFILAYSNGTVGLIKTFSIDGSADNITEIDSHQFLASSPIGATMIKIDATHYAVAYRGVDSDGFVNTFSIDGSFIISDVNSLEYDTDISNLHSMVLIDSTHLAIAYRGTDSDGFIRTISFDSGTGDNLTLVDVLEFDTTRGDENSLVLVDSTHMILAYHNGNGIMMTFSMDSGTADNIAIVDSLQHNTGDSRRNSLVQVDATHYLLAYKEGAGLVGSIKQFSIDGSADNISQDGQFEFDSVLGDWNSLVNIDSDLSFLSYRGADNDGFIQTFTTAAVAEGVTPISTLSLLGAG